MKELIAFEFKKMFKLKKTWIVLILMIVMISFNGFGCNYFEQQHYDLDIYEVMYTNDQIELTKEQDNPLKLLNECKEKKCLTQSFLNFDLRYCKENISGLSPDSAAYYKYNSHIILDNYLLKTKEPYYNCEFSQRGMFIIPGFTKSITYFLPIIFILLSADIFNKERIGGTDKLIFTQPFSKNKIIISKYICSLVTCIVGFIAAVGVYLLLDLIVFGPIPLDYPTFITDNYLTFSPSSVTTGNIVIPLYYYFILSILLMLIFTVAIVTISFFLSIVLKKKGSSIMIPIIICIFFNLLYFSIFSHIYLSTNTFNIFSYMNIGYNFAGYERNLLTGINPLTVANAIVVPTVYSVVFFWLSLVVIKRKQFSDN